MNNLLRREIDQKEHKHKLAIPLERVIGILHEIRKETDKPHVIKLCQEGTAKLMDFAGAVELQKELDEVRQRRIDPTN